MTKGHRPVLGGKEEQIIVYYLEGNSVPKTAKHFGVGKSNLAKFLKKSGVPMRPHKEACCVKSGGKEKLIIERYLSGLSAVNVGKEFQLCEATILYVLRKFNVPIRPPGNVGEKSSNWKGGVSKDRKYTNAKHNSYRTARAKVDHLYKMVATLRARISTFFSRSRVCKNLDIKKQNKSTELLGADHATVLRHIEAQFRPGMSWENHGLVWHVDHRIPLASANSQEELIPLFHYTNLQPLFKEENWEKNSRLDYRLPMGNA